jgi:hypothetical protein
MRVAQSARLERLSSILGNPFRACYPYGKHLPKGTRNGSCSVRDLSIPIRPLDNLDRRRDASHGTGVVPPLYEVQGVETFARESPGDLALTAAILGKTISCSEQAIPRAFHGRGWFLWCRTRRKYQ